MGLGERTWPEAEGVSIVLIPLGSTEQHGPHLPLDTDTRIATAIAERAAEDASAIAVAPALPFGSSGEHAGFAGTISIGTEALHTVLVELVRSLDWADRAVFVNGHGGNHDGVRSATAQLVDEGHDVVSWSPSVPGGDAHAGHTETSLMLAIAPELVRLDLVEPGATAPLSELMSDLRSGGVRSVSPSGVLGDPTAASAEHGQNLLSDLVGQLVSVLG